MPTSSWACPGGPRVCVHAHEDVGMPPGTILHPSPNMSQQSLRRMPDFWLAATTLVFPSHGQCSAPLRGGGRGGGDEALRSGSIRESKAFLQTGTTSGPGYVAHFIVNAKGQSSPPEVYLPCEPPAGHGFGAVAAFAWAAVASQVGSFFSSQRRVAFGSLRSWCGMRSSSRIASRASRAASGKTPIVELASASSAWRVALFG